MRRGYTAAEYRREAERLYAAFPDCAITTDVIVGFPGETDADFAASCRFADELGFAKVHVFPFSPAPARRRRDTAGGRGGKGRPRPEMLALASGAQERYLARWIGRTLPVLFERAKDGAARATPPITSLSRCGQNPTYITKSSPCGSCPPRVENAKENCCHEQDNPLLPSSYPYTMNRRSSRRRQRSARRAGRHVRGL